MVEALLWGCFAASALLLGGIQTIFWQPSKKTVGLITAFGVGVLLSAVSFELIEVAFKSVGTHISLPIGFVSGALTFYLGSSWIMRNYPGKTRRQKRYQAVTSNTGSGLPVVFGSVLDGIPESLVLGLSLVSGASVSAVMVIAVFLSNMPEAITATKDLLTAGWRKRTILGMWTVVVILLSLSSLIGFIALNSAPPSTVAFVLSFSAGALLTMLSDAMAPEAYHESGQLAGVATSIGFGLAFFMSTRF